MKKAILGMMILLITLSVSACGKTSSNITVASREDGSGTREAFAQLFKIEEKNDKGEKIDKTTQEALITNSTSVMMTTIAGNKDAIGYISLGSLGETVKAVKIDQEIPSAENIKNGKYKISRPFNIATKANETEASKDFINYIMSNDGQKIIEDNGYISVSSNKAYSGKKVSGKIVIAGSSSVSPVMQKLKEAYKTVNSNVTIEIQESDSTTGIISLADGICDIGMVSRELKSSEKAKGINSKVIAMDGIVVIVNKENKIDNITSETVAKIFMGEIAAWDEVK